MITENLAARILNQAQTILRQGSAFMGPSKADTIKALNGLLCTEVADRVIAHADSHVEKKITEARAAFMPALERAEAKLSQLRPHYTDEMGMSIDRDLLEVRTALAIAREAAK